MRAKQIAVRAKAGALSLADKVRDKAPDIAATGYESGKKFARTKIGKNVLTGAAAGGAIGAALPFVTLVGGAMLGAGALVLWKSFKEKE